MDNWIHLAVRVAFLYGIGFHFLPRLIREYGHHLNGYRTARVQMIVVTIGLIVVAGGGGWYYVGLMVGYDGLEVVKWANTLGFVCVGLGGRILYRFRGIP